MCRCVAVGAETGSRIAVLGAALCESLSWIVALLAVLGRIPALHRLGSFAENLAIPAMLLHSLADILFLVFLKNLALFLGDETLAGRARLLLLIAIASAVTSVTSAGWLIQAGFALVALAVMLIWVVLYISLVRTLRLWMRQLQ